MGDFQDVSQAVGQRVKDAVGDNGSAIKEATLQMDGAAKAAVANFTGKETYEFGDITKEALKRGGNAVKTFTGKDEYQFGDISKTVWNNLFGDKKSERK